MAIKIQSIKSAVSDNGLKILVHGPAGAGKTVLSATAGVPTLILSAEAGLLSIRNAPSYIKTAVVKTLDDIQEIYDYLMDAADKPDFEWVNLDSISEIAEVVLDYEKSRAKDPRQAYGELSTHMMNLLRDFRDLPGYNVLMTAKQKRVEDNYTGKNIYVPLLPGAQLTQQIPYLFDEVFALRVEEDDDTKEIYRVLQTQRDSQYEAKDRSGELDLFEEPNLKAIYEKIYGKEVKKPATKSKTKKEKPGTEEEYCEHGNLISDTGPDCPKCMEEAEQSEE